jgi:hypothetical protein
VGKHGSTTRQQDPLDAPLPQLIVRALKLGIREHSRYFFVGLALLVFLLFSCCGGVGALQKLFGPGSDGAPAEADFDNPAKFWELRSMPRGGKDMNIRCYQCGDPAYERCPSCGHFFCVDHCQRIAGYDERVFCRQCLLSGQRMTKLLWSFCLPILVLWAVVLVLSARY